MLTLFEAAKYSRDPLTRGALLAIATSDETLAVMPMVRTAGQALVYNREKALPTAEWVSLSHTSLTESSATWDQVTAPIRQIVSDVDTSLFPIDQMDDVIDQKASQVEQKLKALGRTIASAAINGAYGTGATLSPALAGVTYSSAGPFMDSDRFGPGTIKFTLSGTLLSFRAPGDVTFGTAVAAATDGSYTLTSSNPSKYIVVTADVSEYPAANTEVNISFSSTSNQPDGLFKLVSSSQTVASSGNNGDALSFGLMDRLMDQYVKTRSGRLAFVGNAKIKSKFLGLLRTAGGLGVGDLALPGLNGPVPTYRGIPFLQNDWIASNESKGSASDLSSLFLVDYGPQGFYAGVKQTAGVTQIMATPNGQTPFMGVSVREIGELEDKEAMRTRVSWYGAFALGSDLAAARAKEIITA